MLALSPVVAPHSPPLLLRSTLVSPLCARRGPSDQLLKMTSQKPCQTRMTSAIFPLRVGAPTLPISRAVDRNPLRRALVPLAVLTVSLALVVGTILVWGPIPTHLVSLDALKHPSHLRATGTIIVPCSDCLSMTVFSPPHWSRGLSPCRSHQVDISNMSPFVRNVNDILLDDGSAFRELWSGTSMHDTTNGGGSGTTSRRHSVSVVQPRRGVVGFNAPGLSADDEPSRPIQFFGQSGHGGLLLSDEDLADDLNLLSLGKDGPGPVSSSSGLPPSQPSSLPIYAPHGRSPERFSPYQNLNLSIPGGRQALREPSDSGLSTGGSPSLGHRDFQEPATPSQHTLTARFIPGQGIKYIAQPDVGYARSPISPRGAAQQHQESSLVSASLPRRTSDAHTQLPQPRQSINDLGKGVPLHAVPASCPLYIVEFKAGRTDLFYVTDLALDIRVGDLVIVEADRGKDLGKVVNDTITLAEVEAFQRQQQQQQSHAGYSDTPTSPGEHPSLSGSGSSSKKEINPKLIYGKAGTQDAQYGLNLSFAVRS